MAVTVERRRGAVNDAPVLDTACRVLAEEGWGQFTIARVAQRLGRSVRTVSARAGSPSALAAQVADAVAGPELVERAADLVGAWMLSRQVRTPRALVDALRRTARWQVTQPARVLAELVVVGHFDREVERALGGAVRKPLAELRQVPGGAGVVPALVSFVVGLALSSRAVRAPLLLGDGAFDSYAAACIAGLDPAPLPRVNADHMDHAPELDPDPVMNALLNRMLEGVGTRGYDGTRVKDIAADVGVSEGYVFGRFPTKASLLTAALAHHDEAGYALNEEYVRRLEADHGRGIASSVMLRESLAPGREVARARVLELARMGWHDEDGARAAAAAADQLRADLLRQPGWAGYETEAEFHLEIAQFVGAITLPLLYPDADEIPLDVLMVAWDRVRRDRSDAG